MKRVLWIILLWGSRLLAVALLLATLLPFLPSGSWMVRVWDFPRLQLAALCVIVAITLLACTRRFGWRPDIRGFMIALGLAAAWQVFHVAPYTPLWPKRLADAAGDGAADLSLLIVNLDVRNARPDDAAAVIAGVVADAILFIEIDRDWLRPLSEVRERFAQHVEAIRPEGLGMALWSNVALERSEIRHLVSDKRPSIHGDLVFSPTRRVRFIGLHPAPPGLLADDGERYDSRIRDAELIKVANAVGDDTDRTWIIAGDFNDVAWSHTTRLFEELSGLADPRVGRGLLSTYHARRPLLRYPLDHVFVSPSFEVVNLERIRIPGSDHFGVLVELDFAAGRGAAPHAEAEDHAEAEELIEEGEEDAAENGEGGPGGGGGEEADGE